jgi:hypothetical protein
MTHSDDIHIREGGSCRAAGGDSVVLGAALAPVAQATTQQVVSLQGRGCEADVLRSNPTVVEHERFPR